MGETIDERKITTHRPDRVVSPAIAFSAEADELLQKEKGPEGPLCWWR
jgi:hypothetical protein